MRLTIKRFDVHTGGPLVAVLHRADAVKLGLYAQDRLRIRRLRSKVPFVVVADIGDKGIAEGEVGLFEETFERIGVPEGTSVDVELAELPESLNYIHSKLDGEKLSREQITELVQDIVDNKISTVELTYFVAGCYAKGFDMDEAAFLTNAIVDTGEKLRFNHRIVLDKHCLAADTPIIFKNSGQTKVKAVGEVIDKIFERSCNIEDWDGAETSNSGLNNLQVLTFDDDGKVSFRPVSRVFRVESPSRLYKVTLKGNREIKITSDHTVFVFEDGKILNRPAKELKQGDYVVVPSKLHKDVKMEDIDFKVKWRKRNYRAFPDKMAITPEFVRFLAYYIAEGFTNYQGVFLNFGSHELDLINDAKNCIKAVFGYEATIHKPHATAVRVCLYSQYFSEVFKRCINAGSNALEKRIPPFIFDISEDLQIEFIKALIRGDGYVRRGYEAMYATSSKELYHQLQYLLSLLGLSVSTHITQKTTRKFASRTYDIQKAYSIYTQAREIYGGRIKANVAFTNMLPVKEIGTIDKDSLDCETRRSLRRQEYITKDKLRKYIGAVKSDDTKKLINGGLSLLPVKLVENIDSDCKYVYDFTVPGYNKFMAGTAPICVHNCLGGLPGNRTTMVVVPIIAAAGFLIPKTSSRAITSAAGTADTMEVLAPVALSKERIQKVLKKTKACIAWGGTMHLAGADEHLIRVRHPLSIDPEGMMLASILAKKKAVGATYVLIDIPYGVNAKVATRREARKLGRKFEKVGRLIGLKVHVVMTDGSQPIGNGIGPALEARDVLSVLHGDGPSDLMEKSIFLATEMLKMAGVKDAKAKVLEILLSGKALEKFKDIVIAQGGHRNFRVPQSKFFHPVVAGHDGTVKLLHNKHLVRIARAAGAPADKAAGIYLYVKRGAKVRRGDNLFFIHAQNKDKLDSAVKLLKTLEPVVVK